MEAMTQREFNRFMRDMAWARIRNFINELKKNKMRLTVAVLILLFAAGMIAFLLFMLLSAGMGNSTGDEEIARDGFMGITIGIQFIIIFLAFTFSLIIFPRSNEIEYFFTKNISKEKLLRHKIKKKFIIMITIPFTLVFLIFLGTFNSSLFSPLNYTMMLYSLILLSTTMVCFATLLNVLIERIKWAFIRYFLSISWIFVICIGYMMFVVVYAESYGQSDHGIIPGIFEDNWLNYILAYPIFLLYMATSQDHGGFYWMITAGCSAFGVLVIWFTYRYGLRFDPERNLMLLMRLRAVNQQEISSKKWWFRRGIFRKLRFGYPKIGKGKHALLELNILFSLRMQKILFFPLLASIFLLSIMIRRADMPFPEANWILLLVFYAFLFLMLSMIFRQMNAPALERYRYLPSSGLKPMWSMFLGGSTIILTSYVMLLLILMILYGLPGPIHGLMLIWNGVALMMVIHSCILFDMVFFRNEEKVVQYPQNMQKGEYSPTFMIIIVFSALLFLLLDLYIDRFAILIIIGTVHLITVPVLLITAERDFSSFGIKKRRRGRRIISSLIIFGLLVAAVWSAGSFRYERWKEENYGYGDLVIDGYVVIENRVVTYKRDIVVKEGGTLVIRNSTITFAVLPRNSFGIHSRDGTQVIIENSTITSDVEKGGFSMNFWGSTSINNTKIEGLTMCYLEGWWSGAEYNFLMENTSINSSIGSVITGSNYNLSIKNCTFLGMDRIYFRTCVGVIDNCTISGSMIYGVILNNFDGIFRNSLFENINIFGIDALDSFLTLENNTFSNNSVGGIAFDRSLGTVIGCHFEEGSKGFGILAHDSNIIVENSTFIKNGKGGIVFRNTNGSILYCRFERNEGYGIDLSDSFPIIENNIFIDNKDGNVTETDY